MSKLTPPNYSEYNPKNYQEKIHTPSSSREFFTEHLNPVIAEALGKNQPVTVLNIGIGPGHEFDHSEIKENPDLKVIGVDIDHVTLREHTRKRLPQSLLVAADIRHSPFDEKKEFADCGVVTNALMFNPKEVLEMLFASLKPDGKAVLNNSIFELIKPARKARQLAKGCQNFSVPINFGAEVVNFTAIDYSNYQQAEYRKLGTQIYPSTLADAKKMLTLSGFQILDCKQFEYQKNNKSAETTVFLVQKPAQ
ncbi:MAG: class I SAM-dependent methyltransferase [Patescibacteria group bacterium]